MADPTPTPPDPAAATPPSPAADAPAMAEAALHAAEQAVANLQSDTPARFQPQQLQRSEPVIPAKGIDLLSDVNLNVKIELGRTRMLVEDVLKLNEGAVVELDKLAGDPVDVYVNDRHIARGEVLVLNDNFCVRINEIINQVGDDPKAVV
jgi:flagellar motor switch protein FliN